MGTEWFTLVFQFLSLTSQPMIGVYPTYPPQGPLASLSPRRQAGHLRSMGITLAGGLFEDDAVPEALRAAGIRTFGLVVLWQGEEHWKSHPQSRPVTAAGRPLSKDRWYAGVCPNQDWLRRRKLDEIEGMLRSARYDVINLDFIRYPVHWEVPRPKIPDTCYCPVCLEKFQRDTGVRIPAGASNVPEKAEWIRRHRLETWHGWRADQITGFCEDVKQLRDRIRPETKISLAAIPWFPSDYDNAIYRVAGQDFKALARVIDVFNPMSYHVLNGRPVQWVGEVNAYLARETGRPIWPFVIFDSGKPLKADEWKDLFRQALSHGSTGLIAFPYKNIPGSEGERVLRDLSAEK